MAGELHIRLAKPDVKMIARLKRCVECSTRFRTTKCFEMPFSPGLVFWNNRLVPIPVDAKADCLAVGLFSFEASLN